MVEPTVEKIFNLWLNGGMQQSQRVYNRILAAVGGSQAELLRRVNALLPASEQITPQAVWKWRQGVPADRVLIVERAIDGAVTRYEMRPDIFGQSPERATA